jgi:hypothetical protein
VFLLGKAFNILDNKQTTRENISYSTQILNYLLIIRIGWNFVEFKEIKVEDFESHRGKRRTRDQMLLSANDRENILLGDWKYSQREIQGATQEAIKVKFQRQSTMKKENSVFVSKLRRGLDLLSECADPIIDIWRKSKQSTLSIPDCKEGMMMMMNDSHKCLLDDTNHRQIICIDPE